MEKTIESLVWSTNSFIDKEFTKAEMNRVLYNKKNRASNEQEYIYSLIKNIGYYSILISETYGMVEYCFSNNKTPSINYMVDIIDNIKSKCSDKIYYDKVKDQYVGPKANINHGMTFNKKLEYDYVYYNFYSLLFQEFIKYLENPVNKHSANLLKQFESKKIVASIGNELTKNVNNFGDFYSK